MEPDLRSRNEPEAHIDTLNSPLAISTHPVTHVIPYSRRGVGHPWDGANKFSEAISLTLAVSLLLSPLFSVTFLFLSQRSHGSPGTRDSSVWQTSSGLSPRKGWRLIGLVCPQVLAFFRFASNGRPSVETPKNAGERGCAATHNCVSTRSVCGRLDNVMNVDIFPNADITYDPPPSASTALPLFYHHALSSLRDDVRRYRVSSPRRGIAKTPLLCLSPDSRSRNDIAIWFEKNKNLIRC